MEQSVSVRKKINSFFLVNPTYHNSMINFIVYFATLVALHIINTTHKRHATNKQIKASEMLVAPRISECFGLLKSVLVC